ncbi:DUF5318 family protein [Actinomadura sp. KC06]|uniref:DUF5318 family protein n=1 Tax=Actinomadura sp. KC06 TaxID=2530369 RepID=UPI001A9F3339|nr:DUF5318 family protein [Actinomadura sp. KC06]
MYRVNVSTRYIAKIRSAARPGKWGSAGTPRGDVPRRAAAAPMDHKNGEFRVYVVEVCQSCAWNHLATAYVLGHGEQSPGRQTNKEEPPATASGRGVDQPGRTFALHLLPPLTSPHSTLRTAHSRS